jgi:predicted component of type VI protein secretion system
MILLPTIFAGCAFAPKAAAPTTPTTLKTPLAHNQSAVTAAQGKSGAAVATPAASVGQVRERGPITLRIKADSQLNLFNRAPHTLMLCVYHLRDSRWFNQVQSERNGLQKLLECSRADSSVINVKRMVIQPGQQISESIEADDAIRFINIAAGYYSMKKEGAIRSYRVGAPAEGRGDSTAETPQEVDIELLLGPKEIRKGPPRRGRE